MYMYMYMYIYITQTHTVCHVQCTCTCMCVIWYCSPCKQWLSVATARGRSVRRPRHSSWTWRLNRTALNSIKRQTPWNTVPVPEPTHPSKLHSLRTVSQLVRTSWLRLSCCGRWRPGSYWGHQSLWGRLRTDVCALGCTREGGCSC